MRSEGYSTWSVIPSVCLSVTAFSATTRNKAAKKRYQRVQYHTGLILKVAIFVNVLRSKVMVIATLQQIIASIDISHVV